MSRQLLQQRMYSRSPGTERIKQQKQHFRKRIREILGSLSSNEVFQQSSEITSKVLALSEYKNAVSVSIFLSMPGKEVSTQEIVKQAFKDGKRVYVPYIHASESDANVKVMDMLRLKDEQDLVSLIPDAWGIPSISADSIDGRENALGGFGCLNESASPNRDITHLDLIFLPSVAFDHSLNRLGHGKGFYDRYLALCQSRLSANHHSHRMPHLIGLALREQMLSAGEYLPATESDWKADQIVIPGG